MPIRRVRQTPQRGKQMWYWLIAVFGPTQRSFAGVYDSYEEANHIGLTQLNVPFKIYDLATRDKGAARGRIKYRMWTEEGIPYDQSLARFAPNIEDQIESRSNGSKRAERDVLPVGMDDSLETRTERTGRR